MTPKKSFLVIQRIVFVLLTLQFVKHAFFRWDGYSYYMRFMDFLPDLSLSFVLWTIPGIIVAFALWLIAFGVPKIIKPIRLEHVTLWIVFMFFLVFIKHLFFQNLSLNKLTGLSDLTIQIIVGIFAVIIVLLIRKYTDMVLSSINSRVTPLVWFFAFLLVIALPFSGLSIFKKDPPTAKYMQRSNVSSNQTRPNIILIIMDTLTALDMQLYGYERPTTPFISEWAEDAVVFSKAYSSSNWTIPGTMSLMTGQRTWTHRIWYGAISFPVKSYKNNLTKVLMDNGYNIYGFVQNSYAHPDVLGIGESFLIKDRADTFKTFYNKGKIYSLVSFILNRPIVRKFLETYPFIGIGNNVRAFLQRKEPLQKNNALQSPEASEKTTVPPELVYNRFLDNVFKDKVKQPFFVWLHTFPPHAPYIPPKPYMGMFGDADRYNTEEEQGNSMLTENIYSPEKQTEVDIMRKRYNEFIIYCDEQLKLFIDRLSTTIDMSNTIIILSSDHGESFSHGFSGHKSHRLYEPVIHIPLIIKLSGHNNGRVIDKPVELIDIAPTILELAGIKAPTWMDGRSLLPFIKGEQMDARPVFSTYLEFNRLFGHPITKGTVAVQEEDYKLIYYQDSKEKELYDLRFDPGETQNIVNEEPEIAQKLLKLINDNIALANKRITQSAGK